MFPFLLSRISDLTKCRTVCGEKQKIENQQRRTNKCRSCLNHVKPFCFCALIIMRGSLNDHENAKKGIPTMATYPPVPSLQIQVYLAFARDFAEYLATRPTKMTYDHIHVLWQLTPDWLSGKYARCYGRRDETQHPGASLRFMHKECTQQLLHERRMHEHALT